MTTHQDVQLVGYTQINKPYFADYTLDNQNMFKTIEDLIVYVARVSNPSTRVTGENGARLIDFLQRHQHWSPFEMVDVILHIETPRDIARQALRHRSFFFQEFSQRYADVEHFTHRPPRRQDDKNRQASHDDLPDHIRTEWNQRVEHLLEHVTATYNWARSPDVNIAKECARVVLPEGLTMSTMFMKGSIRSWIHYILLRSGPETQLEHRILARKCAAAIAPVFGCINNYVQQEQ